MTHLIDKDVLVAEIGRRIDELCNYPVTEPEQILSKGASLKPLMELRLFLDTLEVKEVDLEKEIQTLWSLNQKSADSLFIPMNYNGLHGIAKYFYELGLKAKGE